MTGSFVFHRRDALCQPVCVQDRHVAAGTASGDSADAAFSPFMPVFRGAAVGAIDNPYAINLFETPVLVAAALVAPIGAFFMNAAAEGKEVEPGHWVSCHLHEGSVAAAADSPPAMEGRMENLDP